MDFDTQVKNFLAQAAKNGMSAGDVKRAIARLQSQKQTQLQTDGPFMSVYNRDGLVAEWKTDGSQDDRQAEEERGAAIARRDLARASQNRNHLKPLRMSTRDGERQRSAEAADPSLPSWKRPLRMSA